MNRTTQAQIDINSIIFLNLFLYMHSVADEAVETVYRSDWRRIIATLIRLVGDFEVAEEAAQEAFTAAVDQWCISGVPDLPRERIRRGWPSPGEWRACRKLSTKYAPNNIRITGDDPSFPLL